MRNTVNKKINTSRLNLRSFVATDLADLRTVVENEKIAKMTGFRVAANAFESDYFLQQLMQANIWAVTLKTTAKVIGSVGLYPVVNDKQEQDSQKLELGYMLNQDFWGNGYMKEAVQAVLRCLFQEHPDRIVTASTYSKNSRSVAVLEYFNFKKIGEQTLPRSVLNPFPQQESYYQLTAQAFMEGGHYATH
ncbi:GNAT family N-acetyltransferase [Pediococcus ethanolidurans]|nr:GNAT family N-acetyltransferase [Pediococcus ethanolidurans]